MPLDEVRVLAPVLVEEDVLQRVGGLRPFRQLPVQVVALRLKVVTILFGHLALASFHLQLALLLVTQLLQVRNAILHRLHGGVGVDRRRVPRGDTLLQR